jgi:CheY-like chemotaxis protein
MFTQKKILLVDDSPTVLLMERLLLQSEPYALLSASNGSEAVKAAFAQQPDLILMDVVMPGMDGF